MSIETAIFDRLDNHAGLTALVASRIYPGQAPQNPTAPWVTYQRISTVRVSALNADTDIARPRFQVSAWSTGYDQATAVAVQIKDALQRYSGTNDSVVIIDSYLENEADIYEPDTKLHQIAIDFEIWHRE